MLENYKVRAIDLFPENALTGRRKIKTCVSAITESNVRDVVNEALPKQMANAGEITYLWDYYRGKQDIRKKEKFYRKNINNKVTVNRANEIVTFKTAYLLNEPIQYISHGKGKSTKIARLNEFMRAEDKASHDKEIVDWMHICGVAERLVLTDKMAGEENGAPFYIYTLDPREAFVIYSAGVGEKPMAGVVIRYDDDGQMFTEVWTENRKYTVTNDSVTFEAHSLGGIPLIEYENNMARMGAFETVITVLNAINQLESDAVDSVQDFVNGFDVFKNCDIEEGDYQDLAVGGKAVKIRTIVQGMEADVYRVTSELNQAGVQQRIDNMTDEYLTICGMPNRNGGSSTSDTGQAVIFRDGWSEAESRAKDSEKFFVRSERRFLRVVLNICAAQTDDSMSLGNLDLKDIGVNFARKSLNNLQSRFQCLMEGLNSNKIHPELLFNAFGDVFGDKATAYQMSMQYQEEVERKQQEQLEKELDNERERISGNAGTSTTVQTGGQVDKAPDRENE
jgi:SPP1 family phage portal protein